MAHQYNIKIEIKFNEHDNEEQFTTKLLYYLTRLKHDIETWHEIEQGNGDRHEDVFFNITLDGLEAYMTDNQKVQLKTRFTGFNDWQIRYRGT